MAIERELGPARLPNPGDEMEIHLCSSNKDLRLPIIPSKIEVQSTQNNETVTVQTLGEVNLLGKRGLKTIELSSFFPAQDYSFSYNVGRKRPYKYIKLLTKWKNKGTILELTITKTNMNFDVTIESLTYGEDDASGDVNYTISLKEYRAPNRKDKIMQGDVETKYIIKKGDTLKSIAKKTLGKASYSQKIYKKNKTIIENALKEYVKKENAARKKYNKKHSPKKKLIKWKNSQKGKRLIPGTEIIIPNKLTAEQKKGLKIMADIAGETVSAKELKKKKKKKK